MNESNLHQYQWRAVDHVIDNSHCGLMLDMGLGKTVSTLTAINKLLYEEISVSKILVIAPLRVAEHVWSNECEKWEHLKHLRVSKILGNETKRRAALEAPAEIYIISRDNVTWLCGLYGGLKLPFDMLVIDESSSFKNQKSLRFKALKLVQPSFDRVVLLTGTPAPNGLIDLWAQIYLLDRGERLGKNITYYRNMYFQLNRSGYGYKSRPDSEDGVHELISDICMSMKAEDYLDMPDKIINVIKLKMPENVRKAYKDFEREKVLELAESDICAANAAALSNKLLQYANGAVYDEDRNVHEVHDLKLDAIEEIIENANGNPVLIAWTYQHDRDRMLKRLKKYKPVQFKTKQHFEDWSAGKIKVMLMHPASGGHGLNLQSGGHTVVWFGQTWSLELYQQLNARLYRQGQESDKVIIHHLATEGTIDTRVISSLDSKDQTQSGLMDAIKALIKEHGK